MNVISAVRRWWWLALSVAALVLLVALLIYAVVPRTYTAPAVIAVVPNEDSAPSGELVRLAVPTYASLATSEALATTMATSHSEDRNRLSSAISADVAPSTNTVVVSVSWDDPDRAAELTNGVVDQLIDFSERDPILTAFIVAPAVPPTVASFPPPRISLVVAVTASIGAGIAAAWVRQTRTVRSSRTHQRVEHR